jgi:hypothetical protein
VGITAESISTSSKPRCGRGADARREEDRDDEVDPSVLIEDAAEGVAALKQEDRPELRVHGSGNLAQTLIRHALTS